MHSGDIGRGILVAVERLGWRWLAQPARKSCLNRYLTSNVLARAISALANRLDVEGKRNPAVTRASDHSPHSLALLHEAHRACRCRGDTRCCGTLRSCPEN